MDGSSDVCSSDLQRVVWRPGFAHRRHKRTCLAQNSRRQIGGPEIHHPADPFLHAHAQIAREEDGGPCWQKWRATAAYQAQDRKSVVEGKSVSVRVNLGGSRILKKQINKTN